MSDKSVQLVYYVSFMASLAVFVWLIRKTRLRATSKAIAFAALFALTVFVRFENVYNTVTDITNVNNLAWFISYTSAVIAMYLVISGGYTSINVESPQFLPKIFAITIATLSAAFFFIAQQPHKIDHSIPETSAELIFMLTAYTYGFLTVSIYLVNIYWVQKKESLLDLRLRWSIVIFSSLAGIFFFVNRAIYLGIGTIEPTVYPRMHTFKAYGDFAFSLSAVWVLFFLPRRLFLYLARFLKFCHKLLLLKSLLFVQGHVARFCKTIVPAIEEPWHDKLRNLDLHMYRALMVLLEGKLALSDSLGGYEGYMTPYWQEEKAQLLYELLCKVDDEADLDHLFKQYSRLSFKLFF